MQERGARRGHTGVRVGATDEEGCAGKVCIVLSERSALVVCSGVLPEKVCSVGGHWGGAGSWLQGVGKQRPA